MKKILKLTILLIISCSVYFIYQQTNHKTLKVLVLGDSLALGINSYGIKEYSYIDYYKDYLVGKKKNIIINKDFSKEDLTIDTLKEQIKNTTPIKKELNEAHQLILNVGYNDLLYKLSLQSNKKSSLKEIIKEINQSYQELQKEIKKYYKNNIIIIGYYPSNQDDYYKNIGIKKINAIFQKTQNSSYIDTYQLLKRRKVFFSNPNSYFPNREGYRQIAKKIIEKTLEKQEII